VVLTTSVSFSQPCGERPTPQLRDDRFRAMLRIAGDDPAAVRTVLQVIRPGL